jgi:hypothetical protein
MTWRVECLANGSPNAYATREGPSFQHSAAPGSGFSERYQSDEVASFVLQNLKIGDLCTRGADERKGPSARG